MAGSARHGFHNPKVKRVTSRKRNRKRTSARVAKNIEIIARCRETLEKDEQGD